MSYEPRNFSPVSEMRKGQRSWGSFGRQIRELIETKQTWRNTKILTFAPIIASATLKAVSLQLNGMLMMWKIHRIQQAMLRCCNDAIRNARIHPAIMFILVTLVTGLKCWYGKISSPLTEISGIETAGRQRGHPLIHTSKILQVRRDLNPLNTDTHADNRHFSFLPNPQTLCVADETILVHRLLINSAEIHVLHEPPPVYPDSQRSILETNYPSRRIIRLWYKFDA